MRVVKWLAYLGSALLLGMGIGWLSRTLFRPPSPRRAVHQAALQAASVPLTAHTGETVHLQDFHGKIVVLLLGYVACPEICTHTLTNLAQAVHRLGKQAEQVQVLMLSADPEHDTPMALAAYLRPFDPDFLGLTGMPSALKKVANALGVAYVQASGQSAAAALQPRQLDPSMVLLDQRGYPHLFLPAATSAPDIAADLAAMLRGLPS